ncbi:MAG TPA: hypothetical protein VLG47_04530 [Candidatus Saccharimonadales bacterium]|nr:hypothetical protein [Candidatus Saccharimonadales bacterium]
MNKSVRPNLPNEQALSFNLDSQRERHGMRKTIAAVALVALAATGCSATGAAGANRTSQSPSYSAQPFKSAQSTPNKVRPSTGAPTDSSKSGNQTVLQETDNNWAGVKIADKKFTGIHFEINVPNVDCTKTIGRAGILLWGALGIGPISKDGTVDNQFNMVQAGIVVDCLDSSSTPQYEGWTQFYSPTSDSQFKAISSDQLSIFAGDKIGFNILVQGNMASIALQNKSDQGSKPFNPYSGWKRIPFATGIPFDVAETMAERNQVTQMSDGKCPVDTLNDRSYPGMCRVPAVYWTNEPGKPTFTGVSMETASGNSITYGAARFIAEVVMQPDASTGINVAVPELVGVSSVNILRKQN